MITRRQFGSFCAAAFFTGRRFLPAATRVPLTWTSQPDAARVSAPGCERRYRADAQVVLFGVTVLHRRNVGDGSAAWRESALEDGTVMRLLEFTGRSAPERAAGLNRFGLIQELSRSGDDAQREAIYFGLMTSSPEESAAEARKALHSTAKETWYSAIDGRINAEAIETARAHFVASTGTSQAERKVLMDRARQELSGAQKTTAPSQHAPQPFLHALAGLLGDARTKQTEYTYNGHLYRLAVERSRDPKLAGVMRVSGSLRREGGGKPIEFRVWTEDSAPRPLPLRIEYQPKSYLRLTFEAVA